jgi:hypothetical protein
MADMLLAIHSSSFVIFITAIVVLRHSLSMMEDRYNVELLPSLPVMLALRHSDLRSTATITSDQPC